MITETWTFQFLIWNWESNNITPGTDKEKIKGLIELYTQAKNKATNHAKLNVKRLEEILFTLQKNLVTLWKKWVT